MIYLLRSGSISGCKNMRKEVKISINDGIWGLFYFTLFVVIMIMWMPSENTSAYAYHIQLSTSEQAVREGYENDL